MTFQGTDRLASAGVGEGGCDKIGQIERESVPPWGALRALARVRVLVKVRESKQVCD